MEVNEAFLQKALAALREEIFSALHAAMPGTVLSYDAENAVASVQPALLRRTASGALLPAPVLSQVPVLLPSPEAVPAPGDPCLLIFADFCVDGWRDTGQAVLPPSPRKHDLSDAFALVWYRPGGAGTE